MRISLLLLVPLTLPLAAQQAAPRAFTPNDWYRLTTLSSPAVSPDGRQTAFTVTTVVAAENKRHSEIWMVPTAGGAPTRVTSQSVESSQPRWSPDGKLLLFTSQRPGAKGRSFALRMDQPGGEAFEYDSLPAGSVTADKSLLVWSAPEPADTAKPKADDPFARMKDPVSRPPFGAITAPLDPARFDGRQFVDLPIKSNDRGYVPNPREARVWRPRQIWVQRLAGNVRTQLTKTAYSHGDAAVSPDGAWIAFTADARLRPDSVVEAERDSVDRLPYDAKRDGAPRNDSDIYVMPATGGAPRKVAELMGGENDLAWSPDGKTISFVHRATRTGQARLVLLPATGGTPMSLTDKWQYEPQEYSWLPSGSILMVAAIGGRTAIFQLDPATRERKELVGGRRRLMGTSASETGSTLAYVASSLARPTELYLASGDGSNERRVTAFNDKLVEEVTFSDAERFTYRSVGGLEIEAWLMKPFGYAPGQKYPLVLYIHGGPHSAYGENWFDEFQNLAGAGMWVLFTNPRGSSGYGADFTFATRGRWFAEDYQDLMKAVDIAAQRPDVDSTRMGVTGGSYGGVMTAWVTVKTSRFKAAETDRMISNWWSWYGSSDAQGLTDFEFYGKPWDNPAIYDSLSPIRSVRKVKTPTLMVQSEEDFRTPMTDAEQWFMGLQRQGTPVELVRYPRSTHELSRSGEPWLLVDRLGRLRQWFGHWLQGK